MGGRRSWTCALIGVAAVSAVVGGCGSAPRSKPGATLTTVATTTVAPTTVVASTDSTTTPASRSVAEPTVVVTEANTSVVEPMTGSTITVSLEQAPSNRLAVWDVCAVDGGEVRIIDEITGELDTTIGLRGRPVWSHDRMRVASLDNVDGTVRIADVATGQVTTIADLGLPAYRGDDCGTLGKVIDWAPDDSAVLVSVATYPGDPNQTVAAFRVDGSASRTLWQRTPPSVDPIDVAAVWLADGSLSIVSADRDGLTVERGDPWNTFPNETRVFPRPTSDALETISISPDGQLTAIGRLQVDSTGTPTVPRSASVLVVNNATGTARTVSEHEATTEIVFAPDSQLVTFGTRVVRGETEQLVIAATDGSGERSLPIPADIVMHASWSTDGTAVLAGGRSLQRVALTDGAATTLIAPDPPPDPTDTAGDDLPSGNEEYIAASPHSSN